MRGAPRRRICGIYKISSPSGNFYIGSSVNIKARSASHKTMLERGYHHNSTLQAAYKKYGDLLEVSIVEECEETVLLEREQFYIDKLKPRYNQSLSAFRIELTHEQEARRIENMRGVPKSEEHKRRLSEARKGKPVSERFLESARNRKPRGPHKPETRAKIGLAHRGKIVSEETRAKLSIAAKKRFERERSAS